MDANDNQEIRRLFDEYLQMYASRDDRLTTHFSEDFSGFTGGGDFLVKDRQEWVAITRQDFTEVKDPIRIELLDLAIQSLADTIAVTTGFFHIHLPIEDHILSRETARLVLIFRKESIGWKISHSSISIPYHLVREGEVYPLQELVERNQLLEEQVTERTLQLSAVNERLANEIEERKQAEEALRDAEWKFRALFNNGPIGVAYHRMIYDESGKPVDYFFIDANENYFKLTGVDPRGKTVTQAFPGIENVPFDWIGTFGHVAKTGELIHFQQYLEFNDRWYDCVGYQYKPDHFVASFVEITDRKKAEQALKKSEELFRSFVENANDIVFSLSPDGLFNYVSPNWHEAFGYDISETIGNSFTHFVHPNDVAGCIAFLKRVMETGEKQGDQEFRVLHKNGTYIWYSANGSRLQDTKSSEASFLGIGRDLTVHKERETEELKIQKLESLGILAGGIAHDFNNILTGIIGNISLAKMSIDAMHKAHKALEGAEKASVRAADLARQLLTFARGGEPVKKVVSLQLLVEESLSMVLHGSNVKGTVHFPETIHAIEADEGQISQVFHNIIINATQAMPGGGVLTITARNETLFGHNGLMLPAGTYVCLSFADEGCGISADDLKKIFDPYFTTKVSGSGLGLASSRSIIVKHGGHISVSSIVDKGTTFIIHLPSIGETFTEYTGDPVLQIANFSVGGSILVMDDEEMIRELAAGMLEAIGYHVTTCADGAEAIRCYVTAKDSGAPFNGVIMDLTIPGGMGGKEAAKEILTLDPTACLIVSSGYSNDPILSDFATYGFAGAIAKPYSICGLEQILQVTNKDIMAPA